jgi:protein SCO1/2
MCPASTMKMKRLQELVEKTKIPYIRFLSITLDPEFDSPGVLKSYSLGYDIKEENFKVCTAKKECD